MSCAHDTRVTDSDVTAGLGSAVHAIYCAALRSVHGWLERRRLLAELQALDDRELRDLHLHRSEFDQLVRRRRRPF